MDPDEQVGAAIDQRLVADGIIVAYVLDAAGRVVAVAGEHRDAAALAKLTATELRAPAARRLLRAGFARYDARTDRDLHIQSVANRLVVTVVFTTPMSLGLVKLRMKRLAADLGDIVAGFPELDDVGSGWLH